MDASQDLIDVTGRLRPVLETARGKLRGTDAIVLAGFGHWSQLRASLVGLAMTQLGWERGRYRFDGVLKYGYARGSALDREVILELSRGEDGRLGVRQREP